MQNYKPTMMLCALLLSACAETTPRYDAEFGHATRATLHAQIIHPEAGQNTDPVAGLDGRSANEVMRHYQQSFAKPEPQQNVFNFGVGSGGAGSGSQ